MLGTIAIAFRSTDFKKGFEGLASKDAYYMSVCYISLVWKWEHAKQSNIFHINSDDKSRLEFWPVKIGPVLFF